MNKKLSDLILKEKTSQYPNKQRIQLLQNALDRGLSIDAFRNSGSIMIREDFLKQFVTPPHLEPTSTDIIQYLDGSYVQMFDDGLYGVYDTKGFLYMSYKLDDVEKELFNQFNNE